MKILSVDPGLTGGLAEFDTSIQNDHSGFLGASLIYTSRIEVKPKKLQLDLDYSSSKAGKKQYYKSGPNKGKPKMKLKTPAKYKKELDTKNLFKLFNKQDVIVIEQQNPRPGNSAISSASTMKNYGKLLALAELSDAKIVHVSPTVWKKHFDLIVSADQKKAMSQKDYKNMSIETAYKLSEFKTSYDGISDAICIGFWYILSSK